MASTLLELAELLEGPTRAAVDGMLRTQGTPKARILIGMASDPHEELRRERRSCWAVGRVHLVVVTGRGIICV